MSLVKVKRFAQVTIPADIRRKAHIEQGDFIEVSYETGQIIMTPKRVSDKTVDWARKFDETLGSVRETAKRAGITAKKIDEAVKTARKKAAR
ncbi:MAG: AbrB/MazE/SpoVT family DNA-binding domain-containing protein [Deltaproteobacteria bacterium]|nr:AbrB/MazE/SpoVT family DNA-binding domain-containing protein [Deltaproteobacteria bacterium]